MLADLVVAVVLGGLLWKLSRGTVSLPSPPSFATLRRSTYAPVLALFTLGCLLTWATETARVGLSAVISLAWSGVSPFERDACFERQRAAAHGVINPRCPYGGGPLVQHGESFTCPVHGTAP